MDNGGKKINQKGLKLPVKNVLSWVDKNIDQQLDNTILNKSLDHHMFEVVLKAIYELSSEQKEIRWRITYVWLKHLAEEEFRKTWPFLREIDGDIVS